MHASYYKLFKTIASSAEQLAERVMDYDSKKNDEDGIKVATTMRDDYAQLADRMEQEAELTKADYAKLFVAVTLLINQIEAKITSEQNVINGYRNQILPKLEQLINLETEEEINEKANELFDVSK